MDSSSGVVDRRAWRATGTCGETLSEEVANRNASGIPYRRTRYPSDLESRSDLAGMQDTVGPLKLSNRLASRLQCETGRLGHDLVRECGDGLGMRGLFGRENKVPGVYRCWIDDVEQTGARLCPSRPACAITIEDHRMASAHSRPNLWSPVIRRVSFSRILDVDRPVGCDPCLRSLVLVLEIATPRRVWREPTSPRHRGQPGLA